MSNTHFLREFTFDEGFSYRQFNLRKRNGSFRRICAPSTALVQYQRDQLPILYEIFQDASEASGVSEVFHGFLPDRNCVTAAREHVGFETTVMMDIADFFDSVTSEMISDFDRTFGADTKLFHQDGTCAQGFATSPILANIAAIPLVAALKYTLTGLFGDDFVMTLYADDLSISFNSTNKGMINSVIHNVKVITARNSFAIKGSKTRVRFAKYGRRHMLGIAVGDTDIQVPRKTKRKLRAARHQENWPSLGGLTAWSKCYLPKALR